MRRFLVLNFLMIFQLNVGALVLPGNTSTFVQEPQWEAFEPALAGFRIEFPARPEFTFEKRSFNRVTRRCSLVWGSGPKSIQLRIESNEYCESLNPEIVKAKLLDSDHFVDEIARGLGGSIHESRLITLDGCPARTVRIIGKKVSCQIVMAIGKANYYVLQVTTETSEVLDSPIASRFLKSFEVRSSEPGGLSDANDGALENL